MKKAMVMMGVGAIMLMGLEYYMLNRDSVNYAMKKIVKNPEKAYGWLKKNM